MSKKHYLGVDDIRPIYGEGYSSLWMQCKDYVNNLEGIRVRIGNQEEYFPCDEYEVLYPEVCRKQAHDEAWEFVKTCMGMSSVDLLRCFGVCSVKALIERLTYADAKEAYDTWVKKNTVKEMTVEEISEALGYDVKIVAKKE